MMVFAGFWKRERKAAIYLTTLGWWTLGVAYVGFKPDALEAFRTFVEGSTALATGFFIAHGIQNRSPPGPKPG
jgi:hypothetical protein